MLRFRIILGLIVLLSLVLAGSAYGQAGSCPPNFDLHPVHEHDEHQHQHIGSDKDQNGDGYLCVKHISEQLHLHIDNNLP